MKIDKIKIGTRGSPLALAQTKILESEIIKAKIANDTEIIIVLTSGDKKQGAGENIQRDKKDWIFELEQNLLNKQIDLAVHSAKDVPVDIAQGTKLVPLLTRENPADVLISKTDLKSRFANEPLVIGTSSLRRAAQLKLYNKSLKIEALRGNINTRISKLSSNYDGIVLAEAGIKRLGISGVEVLRLDTEQFIPASNQGILVAQYRSGDRNLEQALNVLVDKNTKIEFEVERSLIELLGADCHSALGAYCSINDRTVTLNSNVFSNSDHKFIHCQISIDIDQYQLLASKVANELIAQGAKDYL